MTEHELTQLARAASIYYDGEELVKSRDTIADFLAGAANGRPAVRSEIDGRDVLVCSPLRARGGTLIVVADGEHTYSALCAEPVL
ncbi:hypothetical protein [Zavarzinia sp.]|uniref:hypothetical protein n=1 Tax=Zavarzinia sp. TaxID=2027920 RepID=UPI0035664BAC